MRRAHLNADGVVKVEELIVGVGIALGARPVGGCFALDRHDNGAVAINDLIAAVNAMLGDGVG